MFKLAHNVIQIGIVAGLLVLACCTGNNRNTTNKGNENKPQKKPMVSFARKSFDFGEVSRDTLLLAKFWFKNTGDTTLVVEYVNPDCLCTRFNLSNDTISAGDSAFIELALSTIDKFGPLKIYTTLATNTDEKYYLLRMQGLVK